VQRQRTRWLRPRPAVIGQLALRRPLTAPPDHAPGCPEPPRPAPAPAPAPTPTPTPNPNHNHNPTQACKNRMLGPSVPRDSNPNPLTQAREPRTSTGRAGRASRQAPGRSCSATHAAHSHAATLPRCHARVRASPWAGPTPTAESYPNPNPNPNPGPNPSPIPNPNPSPSPNPNPNPSPWTGFSPTAGSSSFYREWSRARSPRCSNPSPTSTPDPDPSPNPNPVPDADPDPSPGPTLTLTLA
jgi:hypothetical protein